MGKNLKELELEIILKKYDEVLNDNRNLSYFLEKYKLENNNLRKEIEILKEIYPIKINKVYSDSYPDILLPYGELEKLCKNYKEAIDKAVDYLENTTIVADSYYHQRECLLEILKGVE